MSPQLRYWGLALRGVILAAAVEVLPAVRGNGVLTVSVARRDLRPLPGVTVRLAGAAERQGVTDENGSASLVELPPTGTVTITPSRSGFRFGPTQITVPDLANSPAIAFIAFPTATDVAISITSDDAAPWVGGLVNSVITLRYLGAEAATDVTAGISSLPGIALEEENGGRSLLLIVDGGDGPFSPSPVYAVSDRRRHSSNRIMSSGASFNSAKGLSCRRM